jgi:hypothetical protein
VSDRVTNVSVYIQENTINVRSSVRIADISQDKDEVIISYLSLLFSVRSFVNKKRHCV